MASAFQKFNQFVQDLGDGIHNLNADVLKIYLSDTPPNASTAKVKADVPEIATGNGYTGPVAINNAYSQSLGVGSLTGDPAETFTASGGSVGPFRYVILYNSSKTGGPLIAFYDYGSEVTLTTGSTFTVEFGATVLQIT